MASEDGFPPERELADGQNESIDDLLTLYLTNDECGPSSRVPLDNVSSQHGMLNFTHNFANGQTDRHVHSLTPDFEDAVDTHNATASSTDDGAAAEPDAFDELPDVNQDALGTMIVHPLTPDFEEDPVDTHNATPSSTDAGAAVGPDARGTTRRRKSARIVWTNEALGVLEEVIDSNPIEDIETLQQLGLKFKETWYGDSAPDDGINWGECVKNVMKRSRKTSEANNEIRLRCFMKYNTKKNEMRGNKRQQLFTEPPGTMSSPPASKKPRTPLATVTPNRTPREARRAHTINDTP